MKSSYRSRSKTRFRPLSFDMAPLMDVFLFYDAVSACMERNGVVRFAFSRVGTKAVQRGCDSC